MKRKTVVTGLVLGVVAVMVVAAPAGQAQDIEFIERFALADDRAEVLEELIPGTEEYYFFHCLHYQNTGQLDEVDKLLGSWIERHKRTPRVREVQNRQALLRYPQDPKQSLEYLRQEAGLRFNHERQVLGKKSNLPTTLDQAVISRKTLTEKALSQSGYRETVQGFEDSALDWLINADLDEKRRRDLLERLDRPDYAVLPRLIAEDLETRGSRGFGSLAIHSQLLRPQMDELLRLRPALLDDDQFVRAYMTKLQPAPDVDWPRDAAAREAYLDRLEAFVMPLSPTFNSIKAHVLYHRLRHDEEQGVYDMSRFMAYIKLPRQTGYMNPDYLKQPECRSHPADLNHNVEPHTRFRVVGDDESLVRNYLARFFVRGDSYEPYTKYLRESFLREIFAETKIVNGLGDMERWHALLPPAKLSALRDRVDIMFDPVNKPFFAVDELVSLDVWVKHVETFIVKVFEINTDNYYRRFGRQVNTDIDLDGLVANAETVHTYSDPPLRRVRRTFEFPDLDRRGVFVIEFIGNGKSSRALIRKGRLYFVGRTGPAGQVLTVLDESRRRLDNASVWLAGHEYQAGDDGTILVPFSTNPGPVPIVLSQGGFSCVETFTHQGEEYSLRAGIHVDRESLRKRRTADVAVRPSLYLNGQPVTLSMLEEPTLVITSLDGEGTPTVTEVKDFELFEDRFSRHTFRVPDDLRTLSFTVKAKVKPMTRPDKVNLAVSKTVNLNQVDASDKIDVLHLSRAAGEYVVDYLGKTGEPRSGRPIQFRFKHRDFRDEIHRPLQTDATGRVRLGALEDIVWLIAQGPDGVERRWDLTEDKHTFANVIQGESGRTVRVPYLGDKAQPDRSELSLLEMRGGTFFEDRFNALGLEPGFVTLNGLPPGDYSLKLKPSGRTILVRLTEGVRESGHVVSAYRHLEANDQQPLQIVVVEPGADAITVRLGNHSPFSRVHIVATCYMPSYSLFDDMNQVPFPGPTMRTVPGIPSVYVSGRNIGDEYRYILDRKYAKKYPGNMLDRPGLLVSPWAIRGTETGQQEAAAGEPPQAAPPPAEAAEQGAKGEAADAAGLGDYANLDFLMGDPAVFLNLEPDENGVVTVPLEDLGGRQQVHVLATDPMNTAYREITLEEGDVPFADLRLAQNTDPDDHVTEQQRISVVRTGEALVLEDIGTSRFEVYDSLAKVFGLFVTLSRNPDLVEFGFVTRWPTLPDDEKLALFSKYACHELSFFLHKKDPAFFEQVVRPFLENKRDKTFLDHWLLEDALGDYLDPWAYEQLNVAERVLLAQRLEAERSHAARHVTDLYNLIPPDVDRARYLFLAAIQGSSLQPGGPMAGVAMHDLVLAYDTNGDMVVNGVWANQVGHAGGRVATGRGRDEGQAGIQQGAEFRAMREPAVTASLAPEDVDRLKNLTDMPRKLATRGDLDRNGIVAEEALVEMEVKETDEVTDLGYFAVADREGVRELYRALDKTQEWVENNYYHLPIEQQIAGLIPVNGFWRDYADYVAAGEPAGGFLSTQFAEAGTSFAEMMMALAVLDLPFEAGEHETNLEDARFLITAASPAIVFHKEITGGAEAEDKLPILISQNFFRLDDRYTFVNNERMDKFVTDEFLAEVVYGCQIAVTNPTSSPQRLDLLLEIPQGAVPVANGKYTRSVQLGLDPFHTQTYEYYFYFPAPGAFGHYPVHVAKNEQLIAFADPVTMKVVLTPTKIDTTSWDYISQNAEAQDVLEFLDGANLGRVDLERIAWRVKERPFFDAVVPLLTERHVYNDTLWSYGIFHNDPATIREFLLHVPDLEAYCGAYIDTDLITIDPVARKSYQHMEYSPLVNARAHRLGTQKRILNDRFAEQYARLMRVLTYRPELDDDDLMAVTYYLLLQERVEDALRFFAQVNRDGLETGLQHDYFRAYLALYQEDLETARTVAQQYEQYPVERWRNLFAAVQTQLAEIDGADAAVVDDKSRDQRQAQLAATEPGFEFEVEAKRVTIRYQNLDECRVSYYPMDVELLFSRNPFVQQGSQQFSTIRPGFSETIALPADAASHVFEVPEQFHTSNVVIEIAAAGLKKTQAYYSNNMTVQVIENYGQVKVTHQETGKPLSTVYVKVFARMQDGQTRFYKDGYTDLRGRFDYTSLNTNDLDFVDRFAILVLSETDGAVVREAAPPKR